ncbi:MAG: WbqC family protein [Flavobacteriaceae bacterium]
MRIVSIHQPHFLPWLNYFNKVAKADVFIWLDDVQYRRRYFQNRAKIKTQNADIWLTVPIKKADYLAEIKAIEIQKTALPKLLITIESLYKKAPFFTNFFDDIKNIFLKKHTFLSDLNYDLFLYINDVLNIKTKIVKSSDIDLGVVGNPNERLLKLCQHFEATQYIAGKGGKNYMDLALFKQNNIEILWQEFPNQKIVYPQINGQFIQGLSIVDILFNIGASQTKKLIETPWLS